MFKPENSNAEASDSGATTGDAHAAGDNPIVDYDKIAADVADTYTSARDALGRATVNLSIVANDRDGYQDIVTPDGHIDVPLFNV